MCEVVAERTGLKHVNVGDLVKSQQLHDGWDPEFEAYILDEDKVYCNALSSFCLLLLPGRADRVHALSGCRCPGGYDGGGRRAGRLPQLRLFP